MRKKEMSYPEAEKLIMDRFDKVRKECAFLEEAIEVIEIEFESNPYLEEIVEYLINNAQ